MGTINGKRIATVTLDAGKSVQIVWNNAHPQVHMLNAWPNVPPGTNASAEITQVRCIAHNKPQERELHYVVKNTGSTTASIDVWAAWWWDK